MAVNVTHPVFVYHTALMAQTYRKRGASSGRYRRPPQRSISRLPGRNRVSRLLKAFRLIVFCILVAVPAFTGGAYLGLIQKVDQLQRPLAADTRPTYIYSAPLGDGPDTARVIASIFQGKNKETASLQEMPPDLLNAVVAKEDRRFREHGGVDVWGILRALYVDIRAGGAVEGASTITQQYVKNAYLSSDQTISRKLKEAMLSIEVERRYSKDEILGMYLNTMYFGNNAYGIEAAAETYYNKSVEDLSLAESAALVGLVWSPSSLGSDASAAKEQRNLVLEQMFDAGYINRQDYLQAREEPMPEQWPMTPMVETGLRGPEQTLGFAKYVEAQLVERYGAATVAEGGLSVYTTLDLEDQMAARETLYEPGVGYLGNDSDPDAALVSIEPSTGEIKAMVGNRDPESQFNLVTQAKRQPGSSFKVFAMIAALEQGIPPSTEFVSEDKTYNIDKPDGTTEEWKVKNYEGSERGPISLTEALWESDNTVFTDLVLNVNGKGLKDGPQAVADVANRLGIQENFGEHPHPSIVLGTQEVTPLEMATAYATIANHGRRMEPTAISRVAEQKEDGGQQIIYRAEDKQGEQVISRDVADRVTRIMEGNIEYGISEEASLNGRDAAGKSGTTENYFDGWFIGFTPQMATALWMGYANGGKTLEDSVYDHETLTSMPEEIWGSYMQKALSDEPSKEFSGEPITPDGSEQPQDPDTPATIQPSG